VTDETVRRLEQLLADEAENDEPCTPPTQA